MTKQSLTLLGALSLVACGGSGVPYDGGAPQLEDWGSAARGPVGLAGSAGSGTTGGSDQGAGGAGEETGHAGSYVGGGGYEVGGTASGGTYVGGGGYEAGGAAQGGTYVGGGGYEAGGAAQGGYGNAGTGGGSDSVCSQNVAQCFDAAANCYQFSPWSDCDQIVDVCAAIQADCSE